MAYQACRRDRPQECTLDLWFGKDLCGSPMVQPPVAMHWVA